MIYYVLMKSVRDGGANSGHHGHAGRPNQVGGSVKSSASLTDVDEYLAQVGVKKGDVVKVFGLRKDVLLNHIQNCIDAGDGWWGGVFKSREAVDQARQLKADMEASGVSADDKNYIKVSRALARFDFVRGGADYVKGKIADSQGIEPEDVKSEPKTDIHAGNEPQPESKMDEPQDDVREIKTFKSFSEASPTLNKFTARVQSSLQKTIQNENIKNIINLGAEGFKLPHLEKYRSWVIDNADEIKNQMLGLLQNGFLDNYMDLGTGVMNAMRMFIDRERMREALQKNLNELNNASDDKMTENAVKFALLRRYSDQFDLDVKAWRLGYKQVDDGKLAHREKQAFNLRAKLSRFGVGGFGDFLYKEIMKDDGGINDKSASTLADLGVPYDRKDWTERPTGSAGLLFKSLTTWEMNKKGKDLLKGLTNGDNVDMKALRTAGADNDFLIDSIIHSLGQNAMKDIKLSPVNMAFGLRMVNALRNKSVDILDLSHSPEQNKNMASLLMNGLVYESMLNKLKGEMSGSYDGEITSKIYKNEKVNQDLREIYKRMDYIKSNGLDGLDLSQCLFNDDSGVYMNELDDDGTLDAMASNVRDRVYHWGDARLNGAMANGFMKLGKSLKDMLSFKDASEIDEFRSNISSPNLDNAMQGLAARELLETSRYLNAVKNQIKNKVAERLGIDASKISDDDLWAGADAVVQSAFMKGRDVHGDWKGMKFTNAYDKLSIATDKKSQLQFALGNEALNSVLGRHGGAKIVENKQSKTTSRLFTEALDLDDISNEYVDTKASAEITKDGDNIKVFQKVFKNLSGDLLKSVFSNKERGAVGLSKSEISKLSRQWEDNLTWDQRYKQSGNMNNAADNKMVNADMLNSILSFMTRGGGYYNRFKEDNHYGFGSVIASASACAPKKTGFRMRFENMNNNYRNFNLKAGDTVQLDGQHFTTSEDFAHKCAKLFGEERPIGFRMVGDSPFLDLEPHVWHEDVDKKILKKLEEHEGLIAGFTKVKAIKTETWGDREMQIVDLEYDWDALAKFIQLNARVFANNYNMYGGENDKKVKNK